jgi:hypothetical protein
MREREKEKEQQQKEIYHNKNILSNFDCRSSKSHVDGVDKLNKK